MHSKLCSCVLHYSVWYKYFGKLWRTKVAKSAFSKTWCEQCQQQIDNSTEWYKYKRAASEKTKLSEQYRAKKAEWQKNKESWRKHIQHASLERKFHECLRELAKEGKIRLICFDFKTSMVLPYWGYHLSPRQVYYMSRMNVYLFGIVDEQHDSFAGYVYPENFIDPNELEGTKKGAGHVISMLYHHLSSAGLTDTTRTHDRTLHFAADNCSGQNKNQYIIKFFCMAVDLDWADEIIFSFMVPGHTKFSPDRWFGLLGKHIIHLDAWNIEQLVKNISAAFKHQQRIVNMKEEQFVNFKPFLNEHYKKPTFGTSKQYHFRFSKQFPGAVQYKEKQNDAWSEPYQMRKTKGQLNLDVAKLSQFTVQPLNASQITVMRECRQMLKDVKEGLDFESLWDDWECSQKKYTIEKVVAARERHGMKEFKIKFKDDKYNKLSDDKYDQWIVESELSKQTVQTFKGEIKKCVKIVKIHQYNSSERKVLVQWHGFPHKQDWTWEMEEQAKSLDPNLL